MQAWLITVHYYWFRPNSQHNRTRRLSTLSPTAGISATTLQAVETGGNPTFATVNLTAAVNQIVLDSDAANSGILSMVTLGADRT